MMFNKYLDYVEGQISNNPNFTAEQILACVYDSTKHGNPEILNDIRAFYADLAFRPNNAGLDWVYDLISEYREPKSIPEAAIFEKVSFEEFKTSIINDVCQDPENEETPIPDDENIRKLYDSITLPICKTGNSAGHDFATPFAFELQHGRQIVIPTGIRCLLKKGHVLKIYPRSGLGTKYRCQINNTIGIIDMDYYFSDNEGHIKIKLTNDSKPSKTMYLNAGDTFCQGIVSEYKVAKNGVANNVRNGGFGSTGDVKHE